jgi:thiol-disulfide isomerase/thioredoxin
MTRRVALLVAIGLVAAGSVTYAIARSNQAASDSTVSLIPATRRTPAPELVSPAGYLNTSPLTLASLHSKVVLVDFWTFDCANCQHTIPALRAWYRRYHRRGFEIVGIHTPETETERDAHNVAAAVKSMHVTWPVVLDPNYRTWDAYHNQYWPAQYLLDKHGRIALFHIGEGAYPNIDTAITTLLAER